MNKGWMAGAAAALVLCGMLGYGVGISVSKGKTAEMPLSLETSATVDPIVQFRTERQQLRQMQIEQLNEIVYGGSADAEMVAMARQRQMELMEWSEQELTLEGVLRLREFEDVLVTVHTDSVNVMVRSDALTREQTAVILELVMRETGISGGNVKIIPIN